jgi:hypothetical protein
METAQLELPPQAAAGFDFLEKLTLLPLAIGTVKRTQR